MDPDINKYDLDHRVSHHAKMSDAEWEDAYRAAWRTYYTPEHIRTILKRAAQIPNGRPKPITSTIMWFKLMIEQEGVHPLEGGAFRLKYRRDRRRGLKLELPLVFYPRYWGGIAVKAWHYSQFFEDAAHPQRGSQRSRPLCVHRPRNRAAEGRRVRAAVALSRHQRRRSRARPQGPRRQHSRFLARACRRDIRDSGGMISRPWSKRHRSELRAPYRLVAGEAGRDGQSLSIQYQRVRDRFARSLRRGSARRNARRARGRRRRLPP